LWGRPEAIRPGILEMFTTSASAVFLIAMKLLAGAAIGLVVAARAYRSRFRVGLASEVPYWAELLSCSRLEWRAGRVPTALIGDKSPLHSLNGL
jgi:hypothetical protein